MIKGHPTVRRKATSFETNSFTSERSCKENQAVEEIMIPKVSEGLPSFVSLLGSNWWGSFSWFSDKIPPSFRAALVVAN